MSEEDTGVRCPVNFDHTTPEYAQNWEQITRDLRQQCPRSWTDNHGGHWIASKYQDVVDIAQRPDRFTTYKTYDPKTGIAQGGTSIPPIPSFRAVPSESDTAEWEVVRRFLNRRFAPKAVEELRAKAEHLVDAVLDAVIETGRLDLVDDLTSPLPALVSMHIFGFPLHEWPRFAMPFHKMLYTPQDHPDYPQTVEAMQYFRQRVDEEIEIRRSRPSDDLLGYLAAGIDRQPLEHGLLQDIAFNIMGGGIDTTTALTANVLIYLSRNPADRQRLINEPGLIKFAREEFVRYFTPVHSVARTVTDDVTVSGWSFKKGERVLLRYISANRDPDVFDDPESVKLDRYPNRHVSFGAGMHRCLGSFLAKMMFETMLTAVFTRMPDYRVTEDELVHYTSIQQVNGWIHVPAIFTPGPKVGAVIA
jgi:cytochrome P450